ncbi:MAG: hypothetical protein ACTSUN_00415 [Promethearchaeota archaeon]
MYDGVLVATKKGAYEELVKKMESLVKKIHVVSLDLAARGISFELGHKNGKYTLINHYELVGVLDKPGKIIS